MNLQNFAPAIWKALTVLAGRSLACVVAAMVASVVVAGISGSSIAQQTEATGLDGSLPQFFSLKSNPVNLRKGPGTQYPKSWVYRREGLPVEVLREHGRWRHVRDSEGATGWILRTLISRRRTALVAPWELKKASASKQNGLTPMRSAPKQRSQAVANLEAGTLVSLKSCDRKWCLVSIGQYRGYVEQKLLWGVYPEELVR